MNHQKYNNFVEKHKKEIDEHELEVQYNFLYSNLKNLQIGLNYGQLKKFLEVAIKLEKKDITGIYCISDQEKLNEKILKVIGKFCYEITENSKKQLLDIFKNLQQYSNYVGQSKKVFQRLKQHINSSNKTYTKDSLYYFIKFNNSGFENLNEMEGFYMDWFKAKKIDGGKNIQTGPNSIISYKKESRKISNSSNYSNKEINPKFTRYIDNLPTHFNTHWTQKAYCIIKYNNTKIIRFRPCKKYIRAELEVVIDKKLFDEIPDFFTTPNKKGHFKGAKGNYGFTINNNDFENKLLKLTKFLNAWKAMNFDNENNNDSK